MTTNTDWLPPGYKVPKPPSDYMNLEDGANKFRVMSAPVMGYEYWNTAGKPVRSPQMWEEQPSDLRIDKRSGKLERIKHFWAFIVWNYDAKRLQVLEITQSTIQSNIQDLVDNPDWGSPTGFDITVNKKGKGLETEYSVQPSPHKDAPEEAAKAMRSTKINLSKLFEGKEPVERDETNDRALDEFDRTLGGDGETVIN